MTERTPPTDPPSQRLTDLAPAVRLRRRTDARPGEGRLAHAATPLKLREWLSPGLSVVSSPMPEAAQPPHVRLASGPGGFVRAVDACLADGPGPRRERSEAMRHESWEARWETIRALIDQCSAPGWTPMTRPA